MDNPSTTSEQAVVTGIKSFLHKWQEYIILPPPLLLEVPMQTNCYTAIRPQELFDLMDACLHNLFDVPRAKDIFDRMRFSENNPIVNPKVYNASLEVYFNMATTKSEPESRDYWIENAWELYSSMENGTENTEELVSLSS